jgi:hypothetical protein
MNNTVHKLLITGVGLGCPVEEGGKGALSNSILHFATGEESKGRMKEE